MFKNVYMCPFLSENGRNDEVDRLPRRVTYRVVYIILPTTQVETNLLTSIRDTNL